MALLTADILYKRVFIYSVSLTRTSAPSGRGPPVMDTAIPTPASRQAHSSCYTVCRLATWTLAPWSLAQPSPAQGLWDLGASSTQSMDMWREPVCPQRVKRGPEGSRRERPGSPRSGEGLGAWLQPWRAPTALPSHPGLPAAPQLCCLSPISASASDVGFLFSAPQRASTGTPVEVPFTAAVTKALAPRPADTGAQDQGSCCRGNCSRKRGCQQPSHLRLFFNLHAFYLQKVQQGP